tara:strand:- start:806 stop:1108 length:303 start_codon:yes stop_codon:yes gene_type:complete
MTLLYITCKDKQEAKKISKQLLEKRLIACANMFPIESMYWWEEKIVNDKEMVVLVKTNEKNVGKIEEEVKKLHSYDIPCVLKIKGEANAEFEAWVSKEVK